MWRGLLLGASLCHAHDQHLCGEDEFALLQARSWEKSSRSALTTSPDTPSLISTVRNLALNVKNESPETVATLIASIEETLQGMTGPLQTEHDSAQHVLNHQFDEIQACGDSSSHDDDVDAHLDLVKCREELEEAQESRDAACELWEESPAALLTKTDAQGNLEYPGCLNNNPTAAELRAHVQAWQDFAAAELPNLDTKNTNCDNAEDDLASTEIRCAHDQSEYDEAFCKRERSCKLLDACHEHEVAAYNTLFAGLASAEAARKSQFKSVHQLNCLMGFIKEAVAAGGDTKIIAESDLDTCDGDVAVDHLILEKKTPAALPDCPSRTAGDPTCHEVVRSEEDWVAGRRSYTVAGRHSYTKVDGCGNEKPTAVVSVNAGETASVRCCSMAGDNCDSKGLVGGCHHGKTYDEAAAICADSGRRLCTMAEISERICCGSGCSSDGKHIWVSD